MYIFVNIDSKCLIHNTYLREKRRHNEERSEGSQHADLEDGGFEVEREVGDDQEAHGGDVYVHQDEARTPL